MTAAPASDPRRPHGSTLAEHRWLWRGLAVLLLAGGAATAWWYSRPAEPVPEPPAVDLSRADPEVARAITAALEAVRAKPRDAAAWGKLGMILRAHDFDTESVAACRTAGKLDPNDYRWPYLEGLTLVLFEPDAGLERLRRAAVLAPPDRPGPRLRLAEVLLERGDLDGAAELADAVLRTSPRMGRAELILARVAAGRGDWAAVLARTDACMLDPGSAQPATLLRAEAFAARGEHDRATAESRKASQMPPSPGWPDPLVSEVERMRVGTWARLAGAAALLEQGRFPEAIGVLAAATAAAPNDPAPGLMLGQVLVQGRDMPAARRVLEAYVIRFPDSVEGWFNLGVARFETDEPRLATDAFLRVAKLKADHALAHFNLGHCHRKLGDKPAAKAAFAEALRCRPDYQAARDALAELEAGK